ncbi:xanthine dehydrogenase family protein molybdopterin-binding subunit [Pararhodobacter sp. CCB-MM2]|uniref:xanthine dehydrogenase family protein molybdopterin-binding subunit n=1 Tax=Pararhodobacter sp. CCB-MM2 TaxID=1786003 RepID=UPI0008305371|nr:molybdopterin cofactor-binding domain-containing protein [Pararhodobacter sp. CCB-MM2]
MSRIGKITRRAFLVGAAAVAGGVAFGVYKVRQPIPNPLHPEEGSAMSAFLIIDQDGVTVVSGRADMGQGAQSTLAMLVAEELDVDWESVTLAHGPASAAYYNKAMLESAIPGADYNQSSWLRAVGESLGEVGKLLGTQITGGSTSIKDGYEKMRLAGASAREALKMVAARRLGVALDQLTTEGGAVIAPDGTRLPYAELAEEAATLEPPQVEPRRRADWKILGTERPRRDMLAKVTGTESYGIDTRLPGMKFATVRMNPYLGGAMRRFDPAPALEIPGVEQVLDIDGGIAVIARNTWAAFQGAQAVEIDWAPADYPADSEAIFATIAAAFDDSPNSTMRDDGPETQPGTEITAEYRLPYLSHAPMEPQNATALFEDGALTLWAPNQAPLVQQRAAALGAGIDRDKVTVHTTAMGGGFGRRGESDYSNLAARVARQMPGVPVQVTWSREEDMTHDLYRPAVVARLRGVVEGGAAKLFDAQIAGQSLMAQVVPRMFGFPGGGPDRSLVEGLFDQPYRIPSYRVRGYTAEFPLPVSFWRSVGSSHNGFIHESFIDEMAHAAGRDPMDFRLELVRPESPVAAGVLEAVREMSGWDQPRRPGTAMGVAMCWSFGTPVAQVIEVEDQDGRIRITRGWIVCDPGVVLDPVNLEAQMQGGMIFGLSAAVHGQITFADGAVEQWNFPDTDGLRISGAPAIEVRALQTNPHLGGVGEPGTPPAAPALANALFALTGTRARELPLDRTFDFVL